MFNSDENYVLYDLCLLSHRIFLYRATQWSTCLLYLSYALSSLFDYTLDMYIDTLGVPP